MTMLPPAIQSYTITAPAWLTPEIAAALAGLRAADGRIEICGGFSAADRKVLRKRKRIPVSEWCERHRFVTMSAIPGPWKNDVTPYLAGVMDASFFDSVQTVIICAAPQTGKSEAVNNCIGFAIDRNPGPVLYVYPIALTVMDAIHNKLWALGNNLLVPPPSQATFGLELSMDEAAVGQRYDRLIERLVAFVRASFNPRDLKILPRVVTSSLEVNIKQLDLIAGELLKIKKALIQA